MSNLPELTRVVTQHTNAGSSTQIQSSLRFDVQSDLGLIQYPATYSNKDIPGMDGARAAGVWVTSDGLPTNDNNSSLDGALRQVQGIVQPNGTNVRCTDLAPGATTPMHRTTSLDYNILLAGEIIHITDDGTEVALKHAGDTVIQKGTMHAWRNPSETEWARWMCVVVAAQPVVVNGQALKDEIK